jgi:hypothetical protein
VDASQLMQVTLGRCSPSPTEAAPPRRRLVFLQDCLNGLPSDPASRRSPCLGSGWHHPPPGRTSTCKRPRMVGVQKEPAPEGAGSSVRASSKRS